MAMYNFYFSQNEEVLLLPIAPSELEIVIKDKNKTVDLLNIGEVQLLKDPGLTDIKFDFELPGTELPYAVYPSGFIEPAFFISKFKEWKANKEPVRLIINRSMPDGSPIFDTNMLVGLGEIRIKEKAGETGTFIIDIPLKEWKDYKSQSLKVTYVDGNRAIARKETGRPTKKPNDNTIVKAGQNLWGIVKKELGDETKLDEVMKKNNIKDPFNLQEGQEIRLR